jgi:hypothetical protein
MIKKEVVIRFTFEGIHSWPGCDIEEVKFLQHAHRHIFHVEMRIPVTHNDRDIEIIAMKRQATDFAKSEFGLNMGSLSCEDMAEKIMLRFGCSSVVVTEDGENGASITNTEAV